MTPADAATLATCEGAARNVMTLLCRCAAASNAVAAATANVALGEKLPKPPVWPWRLALNPVEWAELQRIAPTNECAAGAVAAIEEAMSGPGPGVGTTGVPRASFMQPEEMSRSVTLDPPQARECVAAAIDAFRTIPLTCAALPQVVRDTVKMAAVYAAGCRLVFLMSCNPAILESARQQRSIVAGEPEAVCAALQSWLSQIRSSHPGSKPHVPAAAEGVVPALEAASSGGGAIGTRRKGVIFGAVVDDGGTRYGERGGYSAPVEGHAGGGEADEARPKASRKREREAFEGAALSAHVEDEDT